MKLTRKKVPPHKKPPAEEVEEVEVEITEEAAEGLEARIARLAEEVANIELRVVSARTTITESIQGSIRSTIELLNQKMDQVRTKLLYDVLDFFKQCPYWEMKRIDEEETSRGSAAAIFGKAIREGWQYLGSYFEQKGAKIARYTLLCRQKGYPMTEGQYLKAYSDFIAKRDEAQQLLSLKPKAGEPEVEEIEEPPALKVKPKSKLKPKR